MRILVVEDEKDMNRIIVQELEAEGYIVDSCYDGESAFDYLCMAEYDGAILDVMVPKIDGFTVGVNDIVQGLDLGADDYMVKPFEFKELLARIRMITRKKVDVHENIYTCGDLCVNCNDCTVRREGKVIELSPKEYSILLYLIRNQNIVVSREQIEANIWDFDRIGGSNLVDVYIRYLRKKIDEGFEFKMIRTIRGVGYVLKGNE